MDKVALIIGGTGGIGHSTAILLLENGIKVYATYYENKEKADKIKQLKNFELIQCDIRKKEDVEGIINKIVSNESKIDIVINTATSRLKLKPFEILTYEEFNEDMEVILIGAINLFKKIIPFMKKNRSGTIINLLTAIIDNPPARMSSYVTAKSGLLGLTKSLSVELKPFNINVYGISPSFVDTDLLKVFPEKLLEFEREKQPDKMFIQPEDIAALNLDIINKPEKYSYGTNIIVRTRQDFKDLIKK